MKKYVILLLLLCIVPMKVDAYYTKGNEIYNEQNQLMIWNGVNWFGFETHNYAPHGLWTRSMTDMFDQLQTQGYTLLRIPYSNSMFEATANPNGIDFNKNPQLQHKTPIEILDIVIEEAGKRNMYVLLDRHRPTADGQSELWYTNTVSEKKWMDDWVMLAKRYKNNPTVIGADLHNEPHGIASWGTGDTKTDWRLAAQKAGNAILKENPAWLIVVEGVERNVKREEGNYWWGGNLKGVRNFPVKLTVPNKVVYSTHDYGQGVYNQSWFNESNFPNNLEAIWNNYWGYIHKENIAPILVGEFGGRQSDRQSNEGKWQNQLVAYIEKNSLYWTYWSLNPNSGDTGGLLKDDWVTWDDAKAAMLKPIMKKQKLHDGTFYDVSKSHPYYNEIQFMYEQKYISGYKDGTFQPNSYISRQHTAAILVKKNEFTAVQQPIHFIDVQKSHPYYESIQQLATAGIVTGSNGYFYPSNTLTRAQLAKILVEMFQLQEGNEPVPTFKDVSPTSWYAQYVHILASNGITSGNNGNFKPNDRVTRAHFVVFYYRTINKVK